MTSSIIHCFFSTGEAQVVKPTVIECVRFRGRERRINLVRRLAQNTQHLVPSRGRENRRY